MSSVRLVWESDVTGAMKMPASAAREHPIAHASMPERCRPGAVEQGQGPAVDRRSHVEAEPGAVQQQSQSDGDRDGSEEGADLVPADVDAEDLGCAPGKNGSVTCGSCGLQTQMPTPSMSHEQADRHHDPHRLRCVVQAPHDHSLDQRSERGRQHDSTTTSATGTGQPQSVCSCQ